MKTLYALTLAAALAPLAALQAQANTPAVAHPHHVTPIKMTAGDNGATEGRVKGSVKFTAKCNTGNGSCTVGGSVGIQF